MKNYITSDIFKAAWIVVNEGGYPSGYFQTGESVGGRPVIYMTWDTLADELVEQLQDGQMITKLAHAYRQLRGKLIEQTKGNDDVKQTQRTKTA